MSVQLKRLSDQVIVITGASSGIGLVTARTAARRGARLVLAARNEAALRQLADEINAEGGQAIGVPADVGRETDVSTIARLALERFGGFDTWINNAGIGMYGDLLEIRTEDSRRLFDTNFWGVVYGSLEAARHLRTRENNHAGAIINIGSEVSDRAVLQLGMYSASKHAVKGFTDALRMELEAEQAPITVTLVKPGATNTPFPEHAQNYMEEEPTLPAPVYDPQVVADVILHCAEHPLRDVYASGSAAQNAFMGGLAPRLTDWMMERSFIPKMKSGNPPESGDDALYGPTTGLEERGAYEGRVRQTSLYTQVVMHPLISSIVVAGAAAAVGALVAALATPAANGRPRRGLNAARSWPERLPRILDAK
jgi:short-subunit dehydrogenase